MPNKGFVDTNGVMQIQIHFLRDTDISNVTPEAFKAFACQCLLEMQSIWQNMRLLSITVPDAIITTEDEDLQPVNAWTILVGRGANSNGDPNVSYVVQSNSTGYFFYSESYPLQYPAHELGHMLGLTDRYHELRKYTTSIDQHPYRYRGLNIIYGRWTIPMELCTGIDPEYNPLSNLMGGPFPDSNDLTNRQLQIVQSQNIKESSYPTVVFIGTDNTDLPTTALVTKGRGNMPVAILTPNISGKTNLNDVWSWSVYRAIPDLGINDQQNYYFGSGISRALLFSPISTTFTIPRIGRRDDQVNVQSYNRTIIAGQPTWQ